MKMLGAVPTFAAMLLTACASVNAGSEPGNGSVRLLGGGAGQSSAGLAEYRQAFVARGVDPAWEGEIAPGEARLRVTGQPERIIPLLAPYPCPVIGCEGAWIEQRVDHRHMGANIIKGACTLPGSDIEYPYRITLHLLRSPSDTQGAMFKGCGMQKPQVRRGAGS